MLDSAELFGRSEGERTIEHPSGLRDLLEWSHANRELLSLVVLDGISLAPTDGYLVPILTWLSSAWSGADARLFPIGGRSGDGQRRYSLLRWPSNVLVAATLGEGLATIPPSVNVWARAAYISLLPLGHALDFSDREDGDSTASIRSYVSTTHWATWRNEVLAGDSTPYRDVLDQLPAEACFARDPGGERLVAALVRLFGSSDESIRDALGATVLARIVPHAAATNVWEVVMPTIDTLLGPDSLPVLRRARATLSTGTAS
jgi:hypothetical protein